MRRPPIRARVFRGQLMWHWRCQRCPNYGGGTQRWQLALGAAHKHMDDHAWGLFR